MANSGDQDHPIRKLPSTDPEARDEGPRLIPLPERRAGERRNDPARYVELANQAIRERRGKPRGKNM